MSLVSECWQGAFSFAPVPPVVSVSRRGSVTSAKRQSVRRMAAMIGLMK